MNEVAPARRNLAGFSGPFGGQAHVVGAGFGKMIYYEFEDRFVQSMLLHEERSVQESEQRKFTRLARQWKDETQFSSSLTDILLCQPYQRIIGMGRAAIPFSLRDLQQEENHWSWALTAITEHDPDLPADADLIAVRDYWLAWGRNEGYL